MGAIFRLNIIESENLKDTIKELKKHKYKVYAASLDASKTIYDIEYKKTGIVIGNESNGVSKIVMDISDDSVKIPMLRKNRKLECFCCSRGYIV
jgi:tRNA G18 (ribose-2'-O)-methylase SpoU